METLELLQQSIAQLNGLSAEKSPSQSIVAASRFGKRMAAQSMSVPATLPTNPSANVPTGMPGIRPANSQVDTVRVANALKAFTGAKTGKNNVNGYNASSADHKKVNPTSGHDKGTAFDWLVKAPSDETAMSTIQQYAPQGLRYLIHNQKIYEAKNNWRPVPYGGTFKNGAKKDPHIGHMHLEF